MSIVTSTRKMTAKEEMVYNLGVKAGRQEIVICAAVKSTTGFIVRAQRHGDCIFLMVEGRVYENGQKLIPGRKQEDQGFITSTGRFVTREEGRKLQDDAGIPSVAEHGYKGKTLYSEDLY